jgi:hypothetical protein
MFDLIFRRGRDDVAEVRAIDERLQKVEKSQKPPAGKSGWDILEIITRVLSPVLLALLAYFLTGKITLALQERQVNLNAGKEIQALMVTVMKANEPDAATAAAVALAAYGEISVPPLTYLLRTGSTSASDSIKEGATEGLRAVALTHPGAVCRAMKTIIDNRTQVYTWENHRTAVEFIGQLQCEDGREWLEHYTRELARGEAAFPARVASTPTPDHAAFVNVRDSADNALKSFR